MIAPRIALPPVGPSMVCAGCDGQMVITKDAIGRERIRCPRCQGVSRVRPHPDDVQLPQGLVKATDAPVRVIREVVRVTVPGAPQIITQLPPIGEGQIRCQLCARGVHPSYRFCASCGAKGAAILERADVSRQSKKVYTADRRYAPKRCKWIEQGALCDREFTPSGPRGDYCEAHRHPAYLKAQADANERRTRQYAAQRGGR